MNKYTPMKFVKWEGDTAYFRVATKWEVFKDKFRGLWTDTPDRNNMIIYDYDNNFKMKQFKKKLRPYKEGGTIAR